MPQWLLILDFLRRCIRGLICTGASVTGLVYGWVYDEKPGWQEKLLPTAICLLVGLYGLSHIRRVVKEFREGWD